VARGQQSDVKLDRRKLAGGFVPFCYQKHVLGFQFLRHFTPIFGKLGHHLLMKPHVHRS
jgi:hypothetical protein